jgi:hypothetical protein
LGQGGPLAGAVQGEGDAAELGHARVEDLIHLTAK